MPRVNKVSEKNSSSIEPKINLINIIAMVGVLIIALMVGWGLDLSRHNNVTTSDQKKVAAVQSIAYNGQDGQNALDLLKKKATVKTQDSSMGAFVISINDIENTETQYWMFYVNGELAPIASDQYKTKNNDKIEWRYESIDSF